MPLPEVQRNAWVAGSGGGPPEQVDATIEKAMGMNDAPVVIDFVVHKDAMVWPMVAAGTSNDDIMVAREMAPDWSGEED